MIAAHVVCPVEPPVEAPVEAQVEAQVEAPKGKQEWNGEPPMGKDKWKQRVKEFEDDEKNHQEILL